MDRERILVTVRTYPTPSSQYVETVCTGGITEHGEWRRLFPIPLRYLESDRQFQTYNVITANVGLPRSDRRPESRSPDCQSVQVQEHLKSWTSRAEWVRSAGSFGSIAELKEAGRSIGLIEPVEVDHMEFLDDDAEWSAKQLEKLRQQQLFVEENKPLEKVPRQFRLHWRDCDGEQHARILSWELHQTWRRWRREYDDFEQRIHDRFINDICGPHRNVGLYVGNYAEHPQHFAVLGFFHPPKGTMDDTLWANAGTS